MSTMECHKGFERCSIDQEEPVTEKSIFWSFFSRKKRGTSVAHVVSEVSTTPLGEKPQRRNGELWGKLGSNVQTNRFCRV